MKTEYIIKAYEEELGSELFIVTVPMGTNESEVYKNFIMAEKYATVDDSYSADEYDEHFEDMLAFRQDSNGMYTFNYYLEEYCGYKVKPLIYDFDYEW